MMSSTKVRIDERDDILAVICKETQSYFKLDFDQWASCWLHDERTMYVCSSQDMGLIVHKGWDAVYTNMQRDFTAGDNCKKLDVKRENLDITYQQGIAWATFDEISLNENGDLDESFQTRILEWVDGAWKMVFLSLAVRRNQDQRSKQLAVTSDGHVVWMTKYMSDIFSADSSEYAGFMISAGRFRATNPEFDKALQNAISRAAELHSYAAQYRFMKRTGRGFRYPVILGEDEFGSVISCSLSVRDGVTYIDLAQDHALERRLLTSKVIFGLSNGQLALSKHIASGKSLTISAGELDISVNTARTHLTRIYEKTGVNSQTALVRLLLSVG
ncbi:helix-turn-helix transcriptional regulator [Lentilitoribacter sp. Alg239-R112]|uniref:helix-turn-helix transcriptional regulator n=1 Tax=Lentilitoribacter sp. Alg239-R112 TaxID=2305987 RepID=UPI0013A6F222|nr:helix-turn-helix transcriptional regulator [Lentilitoribacter sp. Alg239-R112]